MLNSQEMESLRSFSSDDRPSMLSGGKQLRSEILKIWNMLIMMVVIVMMIMTLMMAMMMMMMMMMNRA